MPPSSLLVACLSYGSHRWFLATPGPFWLFAVRGGVAEQHFGKSTLMTNLIRKGWGPKSDLTSNVAPLCTKVCGRLVSLLLLCRKSPDKATPRLRKHIINPDALGPINYDEYCNSARVIDPGEPKLGRQDSYRCCPCIMAPMLPASWLRKNPFEPKTLVPNHYDSNRFPRSCGSDFRPYLAGIIACAEKSSNKVKTRRRVPARDHAYRSLRTW